MIPYPVGGEKGRKRSGSDLDVGEGLEGRERMNLRGVDEKMDVVRVLMISKC